MFPDGFLKELTMFLVCFAGVVIVVAIAADVMLY